MTANKNINTYDKQAEALARSYDSVQTPDIIPAFTRRVLALGTGAGHKALDIGCGSGRDAAWLARQGFDVVACDGSTEMIRLAAQNNGAANIRYLADDAPALHKVSALTEKFNVILLNAFIFHLDYRSPHDALSPLFNKLRDLAAPSAFIYTNLRHGPVPEGRQMYDIPLTHVQQLAMRHNLQFEHLGRSADGLGRADVHWDNIALHAPS
jgi:SAM-dependent methyltransferase